MRYLTVNAQNTSYKVTIGSGAWKEFDVPGRRVVVTDENVAAALESRITEFFAPETIFVLPPGEGSKSMQELMQLYDRLFALGLCRTDVLISVGGGVTGDITGFAAATYMRGMRYVQAPTTLLAMTDSSVGGKCAVNFGGVKNGVGAFYQPEAVYIDTRALRTLPVKERSCGMAEIIKYAVITGGDFFGELLKSSLDDEELIFKCLSIKADFVSTDVFDKGRRRLLNLGHTVGHALEILSGGSLRHGEAVAIGLFAIARASERFGFAPRGTEAAITALLRANGLPATMPYATPADLVTVMLADKKTIDGVVPFVLLRGIGEPFLYSVPAAELPAFAEVLF